MKTKKLTVAVLAALGLAGAFFFIDLEPSHRRLPPVVEPGEVALRIHREAIVIDLHVDSLLWPRDLNRSGQGGQVDFPRMRAGGLDVAAFATPTRFLGIFGLKALHDRWPPATWFSPWARYRYQISRMKRFIEASAGRVRRATTPEAIRENHRSGIVSVFHGIEGAHALGRDLSRVGDVARDGVIFIGPVHLSENDYGGSSFSVSDQGLTELGRELIARMNEAGILLDLAHAGPATFDAAIELTTLPPLVSHAGTRAVNDTWRNLSDRQIRAVAGRGGVIGVMVAPPGLEHPDLREAVEHIAHIIDVGGEDAAAIGSDFDGYVDAPIDVAGLPQLTELMLQRGWSEKRIQKILGENVLRVLGHRRGTDLVDVDGQSRDVEESAEEQEIEETQAH